MNTLELVLSIVLLVLGVFLTVAVLLQHGKSYGLSGTIAGGAETFFGKDKGGALDKILSRVTTIVGIVFVVVVLFLFMTQDVSFADRYQGFWDYLSGTAQ